MDCRHFLLAAVGLFTSLTLACSQPPATPAIESNQTSAPQPTQTPIPAPGIDPPSASFSASMESGSAPLIVQFNNTSKGEITSVEWDFGDGNTSTEQSPTHTYTIAGSYTVELSVAGPGGSNSHVLTYLISAEAGAPVALEISPPTMTLAVREGTLFTAVARDEFGNAVPSRVTWALSGDGGSIDQDGLFTAGTTAGSFADIIEASVEAGGSQFTANATVVVEPGELSRIEVVADLNSLSIAEPQGFAYAAYDPYGNQIDDAIVAWTISPDLGKFDTQGMLTPGTRAGTFRNAVRVEAVRADVRVSATADLTILPDPIDSIEIEPDFVVVERGESQEFNATAADEYGNEISDLELTWASTGGEISPEGVFTAGEEPGSYEVNVSAEFRGATRRAAASVPVPPVWVYVGEMLDDRWQPVTVKLRDGKVFVIGGSSYLAELYDPPTRSFQSTGKPFCGHEKGPTATLLLDGRVLVVGGDPEMTCAEIYDPKTETFSLVGGLNEGRWEHSATLLDDGKVLIAGGEKEVQVETTSWDSVATAEVFDPKTETFSMTGSLKLDRNSHTATLLPSGQVLVANGGSSNKPGGGVCLDHPEIYDPEKGIFSEHGVMKNAHCYTNATSLDNGSILITGRLAEVFDPQSGLFSTPIPVWALYGSRAWHTSTLLPTSQILLTGGFELPQPAEGWPPPVLSTSIIYSPDIRNQLQVFSSGPSLNQARFAHAATALEDGSVLIVGGLKDGEPGVKALRSAELFIPSNLP